MEGLQILAQSDRSMGLRWPDYAVMAAYMSAMLMVGVYFATRQRSSEDFLVAGRRMPWFAAGLSVMVSLMSTLSYLGYPGEMIQHGVANAAANLALLPAFLLISFLWLPFFMRMRLTSIYEYLERRFGLATRWLGAGMFVLVLRLGWMAVIMLITSQAVGQITHKSARHLFASVLGWEIERDAWVILLILTIGLVSTAYTVLGGIKAVIWTDVSQFFVLLLGAVLTIVFVADNTDTGPRTWWRNLSSVNHETLTVASWDLSQRNTLLWMSTYYFFWMACTYCGDQVAIQRFLTVPSLRSAILTNCINFISQILMTFLLALCGMALLTHYRMFPVEIVTGISDPSAPPVADKVFPHFIEHGLPLGVSGLVVAAILAVAMSSLSSGYNSSATVVAVDFYERCRAGASDADRLRLAKRLTLFFGLGATTVAFIMLRLPDQWNIMDTTTRTFDCALGPLGAMFMVGMFLPHVGQRAVVVSVCMGIGLAFTLAWWSELGWALGLIQADSLPEALNSTRRPSSFLTIPLSTMFTFMMAAILGALLPGPDPEHVGPLTWRAVVFSSAPMTSGMSTSPARRSSRYPANGDSGLCDAAMLPKPAYENTFEDPESASGKGET